MTRADPHRTSVRGAVDGRALDGRGWDLYLVAATALMPFVTGIAGTPLTWPDLVNLAGLLVFAGAVCVHRLRPEVPMPLAVLLAGAGSVIAVANAVSVPASELALVQDLYLYVWAVALIALLRVAVAAAVILAVACVVEAWTHGTHSLARLLSPRGHRSYGWIGNANLCANLLFMGMFTVLGLERRLPRALAAAAFTLMGVGMLTTKSNGALFALAAGLATWALVRAHASGVPARHLAGIGSLAVATLLLSGWLVSETGFGGAWLREIRDHTVFARISRSSEGRGRIWERLGHQVERQPLGIGPGNSAAQYVEIGAREHKGTLQSKEAHNDYVAYAAERGPLGFAGLLAGITALGARLLRGRRALDARAGDRHRGAAMHAAFLGTLVAMLVQSWVIEQLHFRHIWWTFACMWAATGPPEPPNGAPS
jgi:O-antigen ligase